MTGKHSDSSERHGEFSDERFENHKIINYYDYMGQTSSRDSDFVPKEYS